MMRVLNPVIIPAVHQDTFVQHLLYLRHYLLWGIFREKRKSSTLISVLSCMPGNFALSVVLNLVLVAVDATGEQQRLM